MEELTQLAKKIDDEWLRRVRLRREAMEQAFAALNEAIKGTTKIMNEMARALEEFSDEAIEEDDEE